MLRVHYAFCPAGVGGANANDLTEGIDSQDAFFDSLLDTRDKLAARHKAPAVPDWFIDEIQWFGLEW